MVIMAGQKMIHLLQKKLCFALILLGATAIIDQNWINFEFTSRSHVLFAFKFLAITAIIFHSLLLRTNERWYKLFIVSGLVFSLAGDELLISGKDFFKAGVLAFMAAQLCYSQAFFLRRKLQSIIMIAWPVSVAILVIMGFSHTNFIVAVYASCLLMMVWQAGQCWKILKRIGTNMAFAGALFFLISDSTLAINRYWYAFPYASVIMLLTYYSSQYLIASSISETN